MERKHNTSSLTMQVISYKNKKGSRSKEVQSLLKRITDQLILESYKIVKSCAFLPEEEISGFIIYLYSKIDSIIDGYEIQEGRKFESYLYVSLRYKASNYMSSVRRLNRMKRAYINFTGPIEVEYELSEMENGDKEENTVQTENNLLIGKIAFIFTSTLVWRKRFFIYLCHLLPFIDQNLIETICKSLNIDVIQTLQIRQLLFSRYLESSDSNTGSREYIAERRNFYHCRVIHLETELFFNRQCFSENEIQELEKSLDYNRLQYMKNVNTLQNRQSRVGYDVISDILGVKRGSVASCIHIVRKKLEEIISVSIHEGSSESIKEMAFCTSTFYPYSVFKVCKNSS